MAPKVREVGPFVKGINQVDLERGAAFQLPDPGMDQAQPFVRVAENLDLDRMGFFKRRAGQTQRVATTQGRGVFATREALFMADGEALVRIDPTSFTTTVVATGLGLGSISYAQAAGALWWMTGAACGRVTDGQASGPWGVEIAAPPDVAAATGGSLLPGIYQVAVTAEVNGIEGGATQAAVITLGPGQTALTVTPLGLDPNATAVHLYVSEPNGRALFWVKTVPGAGPILVDQVGVSTDIFDGFGIYPPPLGTVLGVYKGRMLVTKDNALYWSEPLAYHRFRLSSDFQLFDSPIVMGAVLQDAVFLGTESGLTQSIQGEDPDVWQNQTIASAPACRGRPLYLEGWRLPWADTSAVVALWMTTAGLTAGLPDGTLRCPEYKTGEFPRGATAALAYNQTANLRQIISTINEGKPDQVCFSDRVKVTVTR